MNYTGRSQGQGLEQSREPFPVHGSSAVAPVEPLQPHPRLPPAAYCQGDRRLSQLPQKPHTGLPCSQTPGGLQQQTVTTPPYCPCLSFNTAPSDIVHFGNQSHGFAVGCLRLKAPCSPSALFRPAPSRSAHLSARLCRLKNSTMGGMAGPTTPLCVPPGISWYSYGTPSFFNSATFERVCSTGMVRSLSPWTA